MSRISPQGKLATGYQSSRLFYDGTPLLWSQNAPRPELAGSHIVGGYLSWVTESILIFSSCDLADGSDCALYTYNISTGDILKVSEIGADRLWAGGNVWAAWKSGVGYFDSLLRTNTSWSVVGVDDDGTVLVVLDSTTNTGLGYLTKTITTPIIITYDKLTRGASIRRGIVIYHANGVLNRYRIAGSNSFLNTGLSGITPEVIADTTSNITAAPVTHYASDGNYIIAWHYGSLGVVVFKFDSSVAWSFPLFTQIADADIRVLSDGRIVIAVGTENIEHPERVVKFVVDSNEQQYYLFSNLGTETVANSFAPDIRANVSVTATDIIAVPNNAMGDGRVPKLLSSADWFGIHGAYLRGAWQYNLTAVVAQTDAIGNTNVTVKNSSANTWVSGEAAYGTHAVAIRPDPSSTSAAPRWEVSWVRSASAYARVILNANLAPVGAVTNVSETLGQEGMLDLQPTTGVPLFVNATSKIQTFGYVKIQYPTTRGVWTIGQDAGQPPNPRLIAWNAEEQQAYVVWNGATQQQSRLVLEYDVDGNPSAVVTPAQHAILVRQSQFLQLARIDYESRQSIGVLSSIPVPPASTSSSLTTASNEPTSGVASAQQLPASTLNQDTRVFRQPLTVVPSTAVLSGLPKIPGIGSTIFGSTAKTMSEDPPSYDSKYPYNTVLLESESGHLIEADDTPGAERVHIMHRSGTHIEMRPDGGVKYKTVKKRQDFTVGDHEIYIAGDCNIVTDGGYCIHIRKGQLVIDAKDGASINVKGQLKLNADNIELKAKNNIFLNAPKVDIGAIAPGSRPMMSIPQGIVPYPPPSLTSVPVTFVPKVSPGMFGINTFKSMPSVDKAVKNPGLVFAALKDTTDVSGEPAFSRLTEQPNIIPLSNPRVYTNTSTPERIKYRERIFDTPEDVSNDESYNTHANLCLEMNDFVENDKKLPGQLYQTDDVNDINDPDTGVEPHPFLSFPLVSGSIADCVANSNIIIGHGTVFTEDLLEGQTVTIDGTNAKAVIRSIQDDTTLILTDGWPGPTIRGTLEVYRLRPFKDFFGNMKYTSDSILGNSGLTLGNLLVNFSSPIFEIPKINTTAFTSWSTSVGDDSKGTSSLYYSWTWSPLGGEPIDGDENAYRTEFFNKIGELGQKINCNADNWKSILKAAGFPTNPVKGERFTGIYQQADSSGNLRGRLFLPTISPNEAGYYLRDVDILRGSNLKVVCPGESDGGAPATGGGGGGAGGSGGSGERVEYAGGSADELNLNNVEFLGSNRNVSGWAVTSAITSISISGDQVCVNHTKAGQFPTSSFGDVDPIITEGNVWIFAQFNGRWYGATWDWLRVGQTCKGVSAAEFGADQIRQSPMDGSWIPMRGDKVGFMVSTRARDSVVAGEERSNVMLVDWPY